MIFDCECLVGVPKQPFSDVAEGIVPDAADLVSEMERASKDLQCEASLIFVKPALAQQENLWKNLGYAARTPQSLGILAWQEAAQDSMPPGTVLLFKQLRTDRILRPI